MQNMSVQQLLQSPKANSAKGEVVSDKQSVLEGLLSQGKNHHVKNIAGKTVAHGEGKSGVESEEGSELGALDFSSLFAEIQNGEVKEIGTTKLKPENVVSAKLAKTTNGLDQLLYHLKGTEEQEISVDGRPVLEADKTLQKEFVPQKNQKTQSENPLQFLVKNANEKNISINNPQMEVAGEKSELQVLMDQSGNSKLASLKNVLIPNNITNPAMAEKNHSTEQTVKVLSGEDFVKNLNAANPQIKNEKDDSLVPGEKTDKKQIGLLVANVPQVKSYGKGQNILNDSLIRNTNDLAFKETKKTKSAADELKSPETKIGNDLAMIKESPLAVLQLKNSPVQENKVQVETKVLNLSNIDAKNTNEIIKAITDYVEQNQVANKSSLDLTVKHDSLGQFKILVSKVPNQNQVDMQITTSSAEGHKFFVAHEADLMKNLQQSGVNLSDLRIISSMKESTPFMQSESKQFSSFQREQNGDSNSKQFMSFDSSSDFKEGSQKRKSLWDEYQERYGA
jgi:hypothetical protein